MKSSVRHRIGRLSEMRLRRSTHAPGFSSALSAYVGGRLDRLLSDD